MWNFFLPKFHFMKQLIICEILSLHQTFHQPFALTIRENLVYYVRIIFSLISKTPRTDKWMVFFFHDCNSKMVLYKRLIDDILIFIDPTNFVDVFNCFNSTHLNHSACYNEKNVLIVFVIKTHEAIEWNHKTPHTQRSQMKWVVRHFTSLHSSHANLA